VTAHTTGDAVAVEADRSEFGSRLGQVPLIAFCAGIGLLVCSVADALSRATLGPPSLIYWVGILIIGLPIFYRLSSPAPSSGERLTLVCLLGMALYAVKLARDSVFYTFPDEFVHAFNAEQIVDHQNLFEGNPLLPITPDYPGLEGATSALMTMTGMTSYGAGIVVIGAARLALVIGLFFLFRRISGSARLAGLGVAIYAGSSNFLLWGAQYSYQSLALPLFVVVLMALAEREAAPRSWGSAWAIPIVLVIAAIVVIHHLTSYALATALIVLAVLYWAVRRQVNWPNPWPFAVLAAGLAVTWLLVVAGATVDYLSPVLSRAYDSIFDTVSGEASPRALFQGSASSPGLPALGYTPPAARAVALGSVAILAIGLPFGLWQVWRRHRTQPFALAFCAAAIGFFGVLGLRFAPAAWETSNRAGEFLFIGLAFVLAYAYLLAYVWFDRRGPRSAPWLGRVLLTGCLGIVLIGGALSGWPYDSQIAQPVRAKEGGRFIESEPLGLAEWVEDHLSERRFAAPTATARFLLYPGDAHVRAGRNPDIEDLFTEPTLQTWQLPLLRRLDLRYAVADRRQRAADVVRGYSFSVRPPAGDPEGLLPKSVIDKFDRIPNAARVFDSGNIAVYDLKGRR
jgi:hypothetical protein